MNIVILTTQTTHHTYFVLELVKEFEVNAVFVERTVNTAFFDTHHSFEDDRDIYEKAVFFDNKELSLENVCQVIEVETVNNHKSVNRLKEFKPEVVISFGVGKVKQEVIDVCPEGIINLHGGNPEEYRGLDSHLWAIYHGDYKNLIVTLHRLNEELDDGEIALQLPIKLEPGMKLYQLRRYNTEMCLQLTLSALDMFKRYGRFISRPQLKQGRYYSFMPAALKEICQRRFEKYTEALC